MFRTAAMLPERGNKQQQQQFSQKESRWTRSKRSVRESEMPKVAPKGTKHRPSSAPLLPAVPHRPAAALRRTRRRSSTLRAAVWPQQAPPSPLRATSGRALRNAGLRRRAPARPAVPRHQPTSRRSPIATDTDDRAALAAQPRPGAQEGGAEQRHRRAAVLCTRLGRSRMQISQI